MDLPKAEATASKRRSYSEDFKRDAVRLVVEDWKNLKTIGQVISITWRDGKECSDVRYFISSLRASVKRFALAVRGLWAIENSLHWVLDVTFNEDQSRARNRHLADNLASLRRLAIGLLKQHPAKASIKSKKRLAGWNNNFLAQVLALQGT